MIFSKLIPTLGVLRRSLINQPKLLSNHFSSTPLCAAVDRFYTEKHEWVSVDGNSGTVGISDYAQDALGDIVYVQLPDVDSEVTAGAECACVESVKAASDIYSPVSGTVTEKNDTVEEDTGLVNKSCYDKGWLFKVTLSNAGEIKSLMDETKYQAYLKSVAEDED